MLNIHYIMNRNMYDKNNDILFKYITINTNAFIIDIIIEITQILLSISSGTNAFIFI